ncbi:MAG TPA: FtsX-like permease family protein [Pilimelia sp.]|nr:FtsX-like permease family protein [Pilimelia sp.]
MTWLGLRLAFSGRNAWWVQLLTTLAVGAGTALFLCALCVAPATEARADRTAWLAAADDASSPWAAAGDGEPTTTITTTVDHLGDTRIDVVTLAADTPSAPIPPGIPRLPGVGEVFASPAAQRLMAAEPLLAQRYGQVVGVVGGGALAGPEHALVVRGVHPTTAALSGQRMVGFPDHQEVPALDGVLRVLLLLGIVAMLAPIALFVGMATRLTAASRDERLARLRLAGAGARQVRRLAAVEALIPGLCGSVLGLLIFWLARPGLATVDYGASRWFHHDLSPGWGGVLLVVALVPAATVLAAHLALGSVVRSPLSSGAPGAGRPISNWRLLPLAIALPSLGWMAQRASAGGRDVAVAFCALLAALLIAGPWCTRLVGRLLARTSGPARLLAGRRLCADPRAGFRATGGVVLAVLLSTLFVASTPSAAATLQSTDVVGQRPGTAQAAVTMASADQSRDLLSRVRQIAGVEAAALVHSGQLSFGDKPANVWVGDCGDIAAAARLDSVPCGVAPVLVGTNFRSAVSAGQPFTVYSLTPAGLRPRDAPPDPRDLTEAEVRAAGVATMPAEPGIDMPGVIVTSDAAHRFLQRTRPSLLLFAYETDRALEEARTAIISAVPASTVTTRQSAFDGYNESVRRLYWTVSGGSTVIFLIAAAGLVIAMIVGLVERRRAFSLLRAAGAEIRVLRRTVLLESLAPVAVMAVAAAVLGAAIGVLVSRPSGGWLDLPWTALGGPVAVGLMTASLLVLLASAMVPRFVDQSRTRFE